MGVAARLRPLGPEQPACQDSASTNRDLNRSTESLAKALGEVGTAVRRPSDR